MKASRKCATNASPRPFFIFVNNLKQPKQILFKIRHFERGLSKSLKTFNFIFSFKPIPV